MITFHPQRWTDNQVLWLKELILQRLKNVVKRGLVRFWIFENESKSCWCEARNKSTYQQAKIKH